MTDSKSTIFVNYWPYLLAVALLAVLVVLLVYLVRKRKKAAVSPAVLQEKKQQKQNRLPPRSLAKIWKGFLRGIPWGLRMTVKIYQHFIVLGESGSGKSQLINNQTDWQGHARQFYPSYTTDPHLQIYLGSKVLVQEIPADLLVDSSLSARRALVKLWRPLFRRKDPTVVIVVNGGALFANDRENLKIEAQNIRGKINLLSRIRRKPINIRIALTHMDQFEGFLEFSQFLNRNRIPLSLTFDSKDELKQIETCLHSFEDHLTRALIDIPANEYLKALTFLKQAPRIFQGLSTYLTFLQSSDPLSREPVVTHLCLVSQDEGMKGAANPFATTLTAETLQKFNPLLKHRIAALALGVGGLLFLCGVYVYEYRLIDERYQEIVALEETHLNRYSESMHRLFIDPLTHLQRSTLMKFLPDFFPGINKKLNARCIENIRKFYLIPELERFSYETGPSSTLKEIQQVRQLHGEDTEDAQDKALYLLGLIYASRTNELGKLIRKNLDQWADILGFPLLLIKDYVNNNESNKNLDLQVEQYRFRKSESIVSDPHALMVYFVKISQLYVESVVSKHDFDKIQQQTSAFLQLINQLERYDLSTQVSELLKKESPLGFTLDLIAKEESEITQQQIKDFLTFIKSTRIDVPVVTDDLTLAGLRENLRVIQHFDERAQDPDTLYHFIFGGEEFKLSEKKWNDLLSRSRITYFLRDFIHKNKNNDGLLFFSAGHEFNDLVMNSSNDGRFLFTGNGRVDGRYTREAIEQRVRPLLNELPEFIQNLPVQQLEKDRFSNFLYKEVEAYARSYAEAYQKYFMQFDIQADSSGALEYILRQMTLPSSQFVNILQSVKENTYVDPAGNRYLQPLVLNLAPFEFFQRLMTEKKGTFPELDKYRALLEQMQNQLTQMQPVDAEDISTSTLASRLSPLGRISLAIHRDEAGSYLNLVQNWISSVGISPQWGDVFMAPVWQAYSLGILNMEVVIAKIWRNLYRRDIAPLYRSFPFDSSATQNLSVADLTAATHRDGHFLKNFSSLIAPVLTHDKEHWAERPSKVTRLQLPENLLTTVNAVIQLSELLWDQHGEAQPLEFMVRAQPLSSASKDKPIAILSYLNAGSAPVFSFNQQPSWKRFVVHWQKEFEALVGVEFALKGEDERIQGKVTVPKMLWSFFHLLKRAKVTEVIPEGSSSESYHSLSWKVEVIEKPKKSSIVSPVPSFKFGKVTQEVRFDVKGDPWSIFLLP